MATTIPLTGNVFTDSQAFLNSVLDTVKGGVQTYNDFQNEKLARKAAKAALNQPSVYANDTQVKVMETAVLIGIGVAAWFIFKDLVKK